MDLELSSFLSMINPEIPAFVRLVPNQEFRSEKLHAYEIGYRVRPATRLFITASTFFNDHDDLISNEVKDPFTEAAPAPLHIVLPLSWGNSLQGHSHGAELVSDWRATDWWRLNATYSYLRINLRRDSNSKDFSTEASIEGSSPRHQATLQSFLNLSDNWEVNWMFRVVSELQSQKVPAYATSDLNICWRPSANVELSLVGQNLHHAHHTEYSEGLEVERGAYGKVSWQW
jgi:iron complex outermembrane receptor protein